MNKRTDYTFKFNNFGRYNWLRLTPAYSIKLVKELLPTGDGLFGEPQNSSLEVLDPFSGTATTGIVAAENGFSCTLFDINPFLIWFGTTKSKNYRKSKVDKQYLQVETDLKSLSISDGAWTPPMFKIERWWGTGTLKALASLREFISNNWGEPSMSGEHNLLWIAFAKCVIDTSAADFNHVSVSFKEEAENKDLTSVLQVYLNHLKEISDSAKVDLPGKVKFVEGDSRVLSINRKFDLVITSPPYPNRISYIRELRPYMYWLRFLSSGEEAGELDWKAIGGTWGVATNRLHSWELQSPDLCRELLEVCDRIAKADAKNGKTMSLYVLKFFDDMFIHLQSLSRHLNDGARINYILGNSSFYGIMVDTETYIVDMLNRIGFNNVASKIIRKRNSKSCLYEYLISAEWNEK